MNIPKLGTYSMKSLLEELCSAFLHPEKIHRAGFEQTNPGSQGKYVTPNTNESKIMFILMNDE